MSRRLQQQSFFQLVGPELAELEQVVLRELEHYEPTLVDASMHLMKAGGKRLRPVMVLLAGRASGSEAAGLPHHYLAMAVEILHTATLIHDDIIDGSSLRHAVDLPLLGVVGLVRSETVRQRERRSLRRFLLALVALLVLFAAGMVLLTYQPTLGL